MKCCCRSFGVPGLGLIVSTILATSIGMAIHADDKKPERVGDVYTLDTCVVSGEKLGAMGPAVVKIYDGREVRFCCDSCVPKFEADQAKYLKMIDEQIIEQQAAHYPLKHCLVMTDDSLETTKEGPVNMMYGNRLVRFCCPDCVKDFKADPAKYIKTLDAAVIAQQKDKYPLTTCPVSGEKLGGMGEPVDYVVGTTLVRFCCSGCVKKFEKDPLPVLAKVQDAWKASHPDHADPHAPATPAAPAAPAKPADHTHGG